MTGAELRAYAGREQERKERRQGLPNGRVAPEDEDTLAEPWTMPDGREGFVHPASVADEIFINLHAGREIRKLELPAEDLADPNVVRYLSEACGQPYQVIACFRESAAPDSERVYGLKDAPKLLGSKTFRVPVKEFCAASNRLASETFTRDAFDAFFERVPARLAGWYSRWSGDCCPEGRSEWEDLMSFLTRTRVRRALSLEDLPDLETEPEAETDPTLPTAAEQAALTAAAAAAVS